MKLQSAYKECPSRQICCQYNKPWYRTHLRFLLLAVAAVTVAETYAQSAEPYDDDTEALLDWWKGEVVDRGIYDAEFNPEPEGNLKKAA